MISRCKDVPEDFKEKLMEELRKVSQQFNDQHRAMTKDIERYKNERDELVRQLQSATQNSTRILAENNELRMKHERSVEEFEEAKSQWKERQEELIDKIRVQHEQLNNKRMLWLENNPESSAKREAMKEALRDPFQSPSVSRTPNYTGGALSLMASPSCLTPSGSGLYSASTGPPKMQLNTGGGSRVSSYGAAANAGQSTYGSRSRQNTGPPPPVQPRRGAMPTGVPVQNAYMKIPFPPPTNVFGSRQTFHTEPGTPPPSRSNALVLHKTDEELASEYKAAIAKLYDLVEKWVRKYSSAPNQKNDRKIASSNNVLWDYMMNCTYPGHRQDSHTHVVTLLSSQDTRFWFVMRMATQYCVKDIMNIKAFKLYNKRVENTIETVLSKLQERGMCGSFSKIALS